MNEKYLEYLTACFRFQVEPLKSSLLPISMKEKWAGMSFYHDPMLRFWNQTQHSKASFIKRG